MRYALKESTLQENRLRGVASVTGVMCNSWNNEVIFPGAFKYALKDFKANGFVSVGHEWSELPIGFPVDIAESGNELVCEHQFHSTPDGQEARTVCQERLDAGLNVGLSIGFMPDWEDGVHWFDNGKQLLKYAEDNGFDMTLFDAKGIKAFDSWCCGVTTVSKLFEYSIVNVPANPKAGATEVRSEGERVRVHSLRELEKVLREVGFSRSDATDIALHGFDGLTREAENEEETETVSPIQLMDARLRLLKLQIGA